MNRELKVDLARIRSKAKLDEILGPCREAEPWLVSTVLAWEHIIDITNQLNTAGKYATTFSPLKTVFHCLEVYGFTLDGTVNNGVQK